MKFTVNDINDINSELLDIKVHCNKGVVLDPYLISNLVNDRPRKKYDFEIYLPKYGVNLQRPYVWEDYQQSEYIISILQERPLENIIVIQYEPEEGPITMQIVDGKQRLTTIQKFLLGEIPVTINNKKVWWSDFDENAKCYFKSRLLNISAVVYYTYDDDNLTDDDKIRLFNFYNFSGTPQTEEHKNMLKGFLNKQ